MKLEHTKAIQEFLARCRDNLSDTRLNDFLDRKVTTANEARLKQELRDAGAREFDHSPSPSLFLSVKDWETSPYHSTITNKLRNTYPDSFAKETFLSHRLFNSDAVQRDPNRELLDWMKLRALDQDAECLILNRDGVEWMLDAPSESATNDPIAENVYGNVVTFGLGLGYFAFMALRNPRVNSVTVVEADPEVIRVFNELIYPLFPDQRLTIIEGDAYDYWNESFLSGYDSIYADIWQNESDGLFSIAQLLQQYVPPYESTQFWIEESCMVSLRTLIFLCLEEEYYHTHREVTEDYEELMDRTRTWLQGYDKVLSTPEDCKDLLYDRRVLRNLLGGIYES